MNLAPILDLLSNLGGKIEPNLTAWRVRRSDDWSVFQEPSGGSFFSLGRMTERQVFYPNRAHVLPADWTNWLQLGPANSGKEPALRIPLLLHQKTSAFVVDYDAQCYTVTHPRRGLGDSEVTDCFGGRVIVLDPTKLLSPTNNHTVQFNPIALLDHEDPRVRKQIDCIVEAFTLGLDEKKADQVSWVVKAFIAYALTTRQYQSLVDLYDIVNLDRLGAFMTEVSKMSVRESHPLFMMIEDTKKWAGGAFSEMADREAANLINDLVEALAWVDAMRDHLSGNGLDLSYLSDPTHITTVYLVVPDTKHSDQSKNANEPYKHMVSALVIESLIACSSQRSDPCLLMLDRLRFGNLWGLQYLLTTAETLKVKVCLAISHIGHVTKVDPTAWDAIAGACDLQTFQNYGDGATTGYLARRLGCKEDDLPVCMRDNMMAISNHSAVFLEVVPYHERYGKHQCGWGESISRVA